MKSIQPAVVSTLPQSSGVKAQAQKDQRQEKPGQKAAAPASPAAVAVQNASATGGQK
jgi:hypothetical protein